MNGNLKLNLANLIVLYINTFAIWDLNFGIFQWEVLDTSRLPEVFFYCPIEWMESANF